MIRRVGVLAVFAVAVVGCGDDDDVESPATTAPAELCDLALEVYDTAIQAWHGMGETEPPTVDDLIEAKLLAEEGDLSEAQLGGYVDVVNDEAQPGPDCS